MLCCCKEGIFPLPTTESLLHTPWTVKLVHLSFTPFSFHPLLKTLSALSMLPISTPLTSRHVVSYARCAVLGQRKTFDSISSVGRPSQGKQDSAFRAAAACLTNFCPHLFWVSSCIRGLHKKTVPNGHLFLAAMTEDEAHDSLRNTRDPPFQPSKERRRRKKAHSSSLSLFKETKKKFPTS